MTKSVAILGCGPAGLMVAHAANISGWDFRIYSRKAKSTLHGAQYLHKPIPKVDTDGPHLVEYQLRGTAEEYRHKVYGEAWDGTVSPEDLTEHHYAWDLRRAYDWLWKQYEPWIVDMSITPPAWEHVPKIFDRCDLVISTVPRKIWAQPGDVFESQKIWALGDMDPGWLAEQVNFTIICDGTNICTWYRSAKIFNRSTLEWPYFERWEKPPWIGAVIVEKPLRCETNGAPDFVHLGRYGAWEKGILTSDAFYQAMKVFTYDTIR
jgi:hypothetical protein